VPPIKDTEERKDFVNLSYCVDIVINTKQQMPLGTGHKTGRISRRPNRPLYKVCQDTKDGLLVALVRANTARPWEYGKVIACRMPGTHAGWKRGVRLVRGVAIQATVKCVFEGLTMGSMSTPVQVHNMPCSLKDYNGSTKYEHRENGCICITKVRRNSCTELTQALVAWRWSSAQQQAIQSPRNLMA